ncbi:hypothetical protein RKD37_001761 [Streptomyces ambofaciens]
MTAVINLPVYMRLGNTDECHIGDIDIDVNGDDTLQWEPPEMAALLRAAADAIDNPSEDDEEVPDAAARG